MLQHIILICNIIKPVNSKAGCNLVIFLMYDVVLKEIMLPRERLWDSSMQKQNSVFLRRHALPAFFSWYSHSFFRTGCPRSRNFS